MLTDEKFFESSKKFFLFRDINDSYYTLEEYRKLIETEQTDMNGELIYLYATDKVEQYSYIKRAEEKGYNVIMLDGQLDQHLIHTLETKQEKIRFERVDADTPERLIMKKDSEKRSELNDFESELLREIFKSQLPTIEDTNIMVEVESLGKEEAPATVTQNEMMRRMKEMAAMQPGMSFYGNMPNSYSMVVNPDQKSVAEILKLGVAALETDVMPLTKDIDALNGEISELRKTLDDKKEESEKEPIRGEISKKESIVGAKRAEKERLIGEYAGTQPVVKQVIDLALLQSNLLKGEALSKFIARSISLL